MWIHGENPWVCLRQQHCNNNFHVWKIDKLDQQSMSNISALVLIKYFPDLPSFSHPLITHIWFHSGSRGFCNNIDTVLLRDFLSTRFSTMHAESENVTWEAGGTSWKMAAWGPGRFCYCWERHSQAQRVYSTIRLSTHDLKNGIKTKYLSPYTTSATYLVLSKCQLFNIFKY